MLNSGSPIGGLRVWCRWPAKPLGMLGLSMGDKKPEAGPLVLRLRLPKIAMRGIFLTA